MLDFDKFSKTGEFILYLVDLFDACSVVIFLLVEKDLFNLTLPLCFIWYSLVSAYGMMYKKMEEWRLNFFLIPEN